MPGAPQPPPSAQPVADPMADLAAAMATLANVSTMQLANNLSKAKAVQKPSPFKASPAMEEFASGGTPFDNDWDWFRGQFKARFETVDEAVDAKEKLRVLWQDNSTVPECAALFKELMTRTGYSSTDLRDRFYKHLATRIKDVLVHTARPIGTLDELITVSSDLDI
jgi:Retrotransposon gag protein